MNQSRPIPLYRKLCWFALLYAGGFLAMLMVAMIFRVLLFNAVR
jgi:hypothetical protein